MAFTAPKTNDTRQSSRKMKTWGDNRRWFNKWGQMYRIHGPACEENSGYKAWWIDGVVLRDQAGIPLPSFYPRNSMRGLLGRSDVL